MAQQYPAGFEPDYPEGFEPDYPEGFEPDTGPSQPAVDETSLWQKLISPVTEAPGDWLRDIASSIDEPGLDRGPIESRLRGFAAGALGGVREGEVPLLGPGGVAGEVDIAASPLGIAGMLAKPITKTIGMGVRAAKKLPSVFKAADEVAPVVSKVTGGTPRDVLVRALEEAGPLTKEQAKIYSDELAERLAKMAKVETPGIAGYFQRRATLAGRMKRVQIKPLSTTLSSEELNLLVNTIEGNADLLPLQVDNAIEGLLDLYSGRVPQPNKIRLLKTVFGGEFEDSLINLAARTRGPIGKVNDFMRSIITSNDFSAPGIQGRKFISYPEYWTSFSKQFKAWGSKAGHDAIQDSIMSHPNFVRPRLGELIKKGKNRGKQRVQPSVADRAGLDLTDLIGNKEEKFRSTFAERWVPGVMRSERAYVSFLNKLRADMFNRLVKESADTIPDILTNEKALKEIGTLINDATGRGSLGRWGNKHQQILNDVFFAPKLQAGRVRMWARVFNPKFYTETNPVVRKTALRSLITSTSLGITVGELARLGGAQVSNDPTSADFRKIRLGDTRVDVLGGEAPYMVAVARMILGKTTSSVSETTTALRENVVPYVGPEIEADREAGAFGAMTSGKILAQFAANRTSPLVSLAINLLFDSYFPGGSLESVGIEDPLLNDLADKVVPIMVQDIIELMEEDPGLLPLAVPAAFGLANIQTYGRR